MKKSKQINNHSIRGNIITQTKRIGALIDQGKIKQAQMMIDDLIEDYPNDEVLILSQARIWLFYGRYEDAYNILLSTPKGEYYYSYYYTVAAIMVNDLEKLEYYYHKYYQQDQPDKPVIYRILQVYLQKIFEPEKLKVGYNESYFVRQIANYNPDLAIKHIKNNHFNKENKTLFNPEVNIEELFKNIKKIIEDNKDANSVVGLAEAYNIYYPNIGKNSESDYYNLNYITVGTVYNSSDIVTMYPTNNFLLCEALPFPKKEESVKELKRVSQIDKFNQRYGKK